MQLLLLFALAACGSDPGPPASGHPPTAEAPAAPEPAAVDPAAAVLVSGTISAPGDAAEAKAVFVSVRGPRPGPPLAAKRLPAGPFPLDFTLTEADRPMVQGPVPESFTVKATLSLTGDPMTKTGQELQASVEVAKGATGVALELAPVATPE